MNFAAPYRVEVRIVADEFDCNGVRLESSDHIAMTSHYHNALDPTDETWCIYVSTIDNPPGFPVSKPIGHSWTSVNRQIMD